MSDYQRLHDAIEAAGFTTDQFNTLGEEHYCFDAFDAAEVIKELTKRVEQRGDAVCWAVYNKGDRSKVIKTYRTLKMAKGYMKGKLPYTSFPTEKERRKELDRRYDFVPLYT